MEDLYWIRDKEILKKGLSQWLADEYITSHFDDDSIFMDEYYYFPDGDVNTWVNECLLFEINSSEEELIEFMTILLKNDITLSDIIPLAEKLVDKELKRIEEEE